MCVHVPCVCVCVFVRARVWAKGQLKEVRDQTKIITLGGKQVNLLSPENQLVKIPDILDYV